MIKESYTTFKRCCIHNTACAYFLQNQQVLVASNQIVGFCFYGQCKQIVISLISTNRNLLLGFKYLSNELHKLYKRLYILLREILREFGTRRNIANLFKEFITKNQLNAFITQQVNKTGKPSSNKKANPAVGVNNDTKLRFSWHSAYVLQPSLRPLCPLQKSRLYGTFQGIDSVQHGCSDVSRLYPTAIVSEQAFAVLGTISDYS